MRAEEFQRAGPALINEKLFGSGLAVSGDKMTDLHEIPAYRQEPHIVNIDIGEPFLDFASGFASMPGTVLLMSGGDLDCGRYHILGVKPWLGFTGRGRIMKVSSDNKTTTFEANPFETLRRILRIYHIDSPGAALPFTSGLMGYLAYDLKDHIEHLPHTSVDDLGLPDICLFAPSIIFIHDKRDGATRQCTLVKTPPGPEGGPLFPDGYISILTTGPHDKGKAFRGLSGLRSNMTRPEYIASLEKIKKYITSGDVYQVNFSQRFEKSFSGDAFDLFKSFYLDNPAPFFAYINAGDHRIVSTSPERFICRKGADVETRPIKGTRPRGKSRQEDEALKNDLVKSKKDDAELSMIVDLMRNDLGKVCEAGSVHVAQHKRVEEYENVYHMVSIVKGRLSNDCDSVDLIKATFPGGSITGCPKIRAMEIIDELEPNRRHVYTGSIGYMSFHDTMDLSVAIRTATIYNDKIFFSVGGGIVYDSDPSEEYDETLHKGKTLMKAKEGGKEDTRKETAWINGMIRPLDQAHVNVSDLGFQYGYGFFETIRFAGKKACYLDEHITRFNLAWRELFHDEFPDLSWDKIINQVIDSNMLKDMVSSVKIIAAWGTRTSPPYDHTIIVTARKYAPRLQGEKAGGLRLITYPHPRQTPLADHKTMNYLFYHLAGKWAGEHGADEALILNPDMTVSETNTANIIVIKGKKVIKPMSPHVLAGIMEQKVSELLFQRGYDLEKRSLIPEDLFFADHVMITNSLMGAAPVTHIDDNAVNNSHEICKKINDVLL